MVIIPNLKLITVYGIVNNQISRKIYDYKISIPIIMIKFILHNLKYITFCTK